MLRLSVLLLALFNLLYLSWSQGWLAAYGWPKAADREPQRLAQQVRAEAIRWVDERSLQAGADAAPASLSCLITAELGASERDRVQAAAQQILPAGSWEVLEQSALAPYVIYMGPYAQAQALQAKQEELRRLGLSFEVLGKSAQSPGLSLGSYPSAAQAQAALEGFQARGVRTAQVLQMASGARSWRLRLAAVDVNVLTRLPELASALPNLGLMPCPAQP